MDAELEEVFVDVESDEELEPRALANDGRAGPSDDVSISYDD